MLCVFCLARDGLLEAPRTKSSLPKIVRPTRPKRKKIFRSAFGSYDPDNVGTM